MDTREIAAQLKESMRISTDALDNELLRNAEMCLDDLERVGVRREDKNGGRLSRLGYVGLREKAIELSVKWQFDFMGKGEMYRRNYEALRDALSMSEDYRE